MISKELLDAYKSTIYKVYHPLIVIRIGKHGQDIDALLREQKAIYWAFITAHNPYSKLLADSENEQRHEKLKLHVSDYAIYEGEGIGDDNRWKPEKSLLIIGITIEEAMKVGSAFEQNAIVFGEINKPAELHQLF